jgi:hypothetical protein
MDRVLLSMCVSTPYDAIASMCAVWYSVCCTRIRLVSRVSNIRLLLSQCQRRSNHGSLNHYIWCRENEKKTDDLTGTTPWLPEHTESLANRDRAMSPLLIIATSVGRVLLGTQRFLSVLTRDRHQSLSWVTCGDFHYFGLNHCLFILWSLQHLRTLKSQLHFEG